MRVLNTVQLAFMQSDGGLAPVGAFSGYRAILSGPAGGYVGFAATTRGPELRAGGRRASLARVGEGGGEVQGEGEGEGGR